MPVLYGSPIPVTAKMRSPASRDTDAMSYSSGSDIGTSVVGLPIGCGSTGCAAHAASRIRRFTGAPSCRGQPQGHEASPYFRFLFRLSEDGLVAWPLDGHRETRRLGE